MSPAPGSGPDGGTAADHSMTATCPCPHVSQATTTSQHSKIVKNNKTQSA